MTFWSALLLALSVTRAVVLVPEQHSALMLIYNATGSTESFVENLKLNKSALRLPDNSAFLCSIRRDGRMCFV